MGGVYSSIWRIPDFKRWLAGLEEGRAWVMAQERRALTWISIVWEMGTVAWRLAFIAKAVRGRFSVSFQSGMVIPVL